MSVNKLSQTVKPEVTAKYVHALTQPSEHLNFCCHTTIISYNTLSCIGVGWRDDMSISSTRTLREGMIISPCSYQGNKGKLYI